MPYALRKPTLGRPRFTTEKAALLPNFWTYQVYVGIKKIFFGLLNVLPLPPKTRFRQAGRRRRRTATAPLPMPTLPPSCRRRQLCLCFHCHRCRCHCCCFRCRCCFLLIVDCLCPRQLCRRRCLHGHPSVVRWQHGGGGGCRGHGFRRRAVNALPAATTTATATTTNALPLRFPPRCCHR